MLKRQFFIISFCCLSSLLIATTIKARQPIIITHALGCIENFSYTNSFEAFKHNYHSGKRYFEVDFALTKDKKIVCFHPGEESRYKPKIYSVSKITEREFAKLKIDSRFHTLRISDIFRIMANFEDMYIVTDTKSWSTEFVDAFAKALTLVNPSITKRIYIQIYNTNDYKLLSQLFSQIEVAGVIYTLYQLDTSYDNVLQFCKTNKISTIAVEIERLERRPDLFLWFKSKGLRVFVFTVNDKKYLDYVLSLGFDGIYTDTL